ncbi:MAG TPA: zf-HC2 domain-containing protein [Vicinamibacterales bacterium]|nr:zf-HC2 domain-containing protein [Vicinamibacterales bacterium]
MPCCRIVSLLADYLEGRLAPAVRADLDRHLAGCDACLRQLRSYESTLSLLRSLRDEDLPEELRCSLRAFLDARERN